MSLIKDYKGPMGKISAYYSALWPGHRPHGIHQHPEEEMIVLLKGELEIISPDHRIRIGPGSCFFHPPGDLHTIESVGNEPASFLIFKWTKELKSRLQKDFTAQFRLFDPIELPAWDSQKPHQQKQIWKNQPLANGGSLTLYQAYHHPYTGFPIHFHDYDVMAILLTGQMDILGFVATAPSIIYYSAGILHGLAPTSSEAINYLEFQFHQPPIAR
ncbi:cupin domain-containing protein [Thermosynechococcaceae cyanobacterium BACA0444]|uniref:Cupin domain-containing protein n=1 Tax=Pseudocalidococcus azoricus BACA0444 TaxID=2918990 RepID=A0AAE4FU37_9CYAN|nr:cupin domain-containing protein [Pseudocalidococcus azoricus]MDS3861607.1 cupin domain-containing protein [Pseudocalidococcus azoricus BACA0444]